MANKWCKEKLPIGSIRIRKRGSISVRFIKVTHRKRRSWIPLARYTWEQTHGPVPPGKRVVHLDGNTLNDNPGNYGLLTAGEVITLAHQLNPEMSEENRRGKKRRTATAEHNRLRGQIRRGTQFLPTRWYLLDPSARVVFEPPVRSLRKLAAHVGIQIAINGKIAKRRLDALPYRFTRGRDLPPDAKLFTRMPLAHVTPYEHRSA